MPPTPKPTAPVKPPGDPALLRNALLWTWLTVSAFAGTNFLVLMLGPRAGVVSIVALVIFLVASRKTARAGCYPRRSPHA